MTMRHISVAAVLALAAGSLTCSSNPTGPDYNPVIPGVWAPAVTNAQYPLIPGTNWRYEGQTSDGLEADVVEVQSDIRMVNGVAATAVRDRVYLDGTLVEDTSDWYAQDGAGNVWYLGEDAKEIQNGQVVNTEGSWEWGKSGALPGIIMWADPSAHVGEEYRQEFLAGTAEDWAKVVGLTESVVVPLGSFTNCLKTEEWSGLESGRENKYYCFPIGLVLETAAGGGSRSELVAHATP